ncbi:MAG: single-stranded DNA-binding protein [Bacteroidetes bacterium]|jgi:single-strand DNA-binding protein|nr:single-stranded DNA-binding protein [Bacteroidota bacterium]MBT5529914.1 single-stranded DNA-binding protein [Cytophagia bacterium]MBT3421670.1 single-stranded DNA-binding protein [Bacteroidota bacterium]MBT3799710.1 single-stranded DNA-binding protein [Bacteroidota bacterium]MBT3935040.1 single-stranded DNA-binding protein [Bacteroidota bacterium]
MASVNKVILVGNVGKDPELRTFDSGTTKASFSMATSETYKNREGEKVTNTEWHNLVVWGNLTKVVEQFVKKGSQIYIEGKLTSRSYESDGVTKYITEVRVNDLVLLGGRRDDNAGGGNQHDNSNQSTPSTPDTDVSSNDADDLPF